MLIHKFALMSFSIANFSKYGGSSRWRSRAASVVRAAVVGVSLGAVQLQVLATVFGGLRVGDVEDLHFFELRCLKVTELRITFNVFAMFEGHRVADYLQCFNSNASGLTA